MFDSLSGFYNSAEWKGIRQSLIAKRVDKFGMTICEECGKPIINGYDIIAHHIQPLTLQNVNDFSISLNPANIKLVHIACHNEIHKRFGYTAMRKAYLVTGAPCSGKTTFVNSHKGNSDLVIDMDSIWQCITGERYYKPNALKQIAFSIRDNLYDIVKTRTGRWETAWIIAGLPHKGERERLLALLGAEHIYIDTDKNECLRRLQTDETRRKYISEWQRYITDYFIEYQE